MKIFVPQKTVTFEIPEPTLKVFRGVTAFRFDSYEHYENWIAENIDKLKPGDLILFRDDTPEMYYDESDVIMFKGIKYNDEDIRQEITELSNSIPTQISDAVSEHNTDEIAHPFINNKLDTMNENINDKLDVIIEMLGNCGSTPAGEWDDLIAIWDANKNENSRILLVLSDSLPTFVFNQTQLGNSGCTYRTSDGKIYSANATHTWDTAQDIPRENGYIRWIIVDSVNASMTCNVANQTNNYCVFAYFGNNAVLTNISFGSSTSANTARILEAVLTDGNATASASIGSYAFDGCTSLQSIVIPSGVTSIGSYAFRGCTPLQSIVIPSGVTSIGTYAFYGCTSLQSVVIPSGVTSIGTSTFQGCSSLQSVVIPSGVTSIESSAFQSCYSLQSVVIPSGCIIPEFSISSSTFFPERAAIDFANNLGVALTARTLTFGSTLLNRWSAQTKALFTAKGYTLA
jgi:hypothetical protein